MNTTKSKRQPKPTPERALDQVVRRLAALPDEPDLPASTTRRRLDTLREEKAALEHRINIARDGKATLASLTPEADEEWATT